MSPRSGGNVLRCCSRRRNGKSLIALGLQLWKSSNAGVSPCPSAATASVAKQPSGGGSRDDTCWAKQGRDMMSSGGAHGSRERRAVRRSGR